MNRIETKQCTCAKLFENIAMELDEQFELTTESNISGDALMLYQQIYDSSVRLFTRVGFDIVRSKITNKHTVQFAVDDIKTSNEVMSYMNAMLEENATNYFSSNSTLYPLTIIMDRYSGTYCPIEEEGSFIAFNHAAYEIPQEIYGDDIEAADAWQEVLANKMKFAAGTTPEEAIANLKKKINNPI